MATIKRVGWSSEFGREIAEAAGVFLDEVREDVIGLRSFAYEVTGEGQNRLYLVLRGNGYDMWIDAAAGRGLLTRAICDRLYQTAKSAGMRRIIFVTTEQGIVEGIQRFGYHPTKIGYNRLGQPVYSIQVS